MARQVSQSSVSRSHTNSNTNWWDIHANPISSWNSWQHQKLMDTNSAGISIDGGASSFPNASNNSGGDPTALLWNHVLLNEGDVHKNQGDDDPPENFNLLETLSSKNLAADMFGGPACDYLKKLDESWELAASVPFPTATATATAATSTAGKLIDRESSTKLSDLVSNWSIAPPQPGFDHHLHGSATTTDCLRKHIQLQNSSPYSSCSYSELSGGSITGEAGMLAFSYGDDDDDDDDTGLIQQHLHAVGLGNSISEIGDRYAPWSDTRNFTDLINFGGSVSNNTTKQLVTVDQLDSSSTQSRKEVKKIIGAGNVKGKKKKRSDKSADGVLKKCKKHEITSSNLSSTKIQVPRVKLGEKITALQQMVSPFGKTDTASVLMEAINYIKFLHEQVQLLTQDPFTKSGLAKNLRSWGDPERKDKNEIKLDLGSRGLCLVPISSTRQIYGSENLNGADCWTPNYRGFLYR